MTALAFFAGCIIGACVGVVAMAAICASRFGNDQETP